MYQTLHLICIFVILFSHNLKQKFPVHLKRTWFTCKIYTGIQLYKFFLSDCIKLNFDLIKGCLCSWQMVVFVVYFICYMMQVFVKRGMKMKSLHIAIQPYAHLHKFDLHVFSKTKYYLSLWMFVYLTLYSFWCKVIFIIRIYTIMMFLSM